MDLAYTILGGTNADRGGFHVLMSCGFSSSVFSCFIGWISCRAFCSCYLSISQVCRHQFCMVMSLGPAWNGVVHLHTLGNNHRRPRHVGEFTISSGIRQYCFMVNKEFRKISLLGLCKLPSRELFCCGCGSNSPTFWALLVLITTETLFSRTRSSEGDLRAFPQNCTTLHILQSTARWLCHWNGKRVWRWCYVMVDHVSLQWLI